MRWELTRSNIQPVGLCLFEGHNLFSHDKLELNLQLVGSNAHRHRFRLKYELRIAERAHFRNIQAKSNSSAAETRWHDPVNHPIRCISDGKTNPRSVATPINWAINYGIAVKQAAYAIRAIGKQADRNNATKPSAP